jgi:hypothetical protein
MHMNIHFAFNFSSLHPNDNVDDDDDYDVKLNVCLNC